MPTLATFCQSNGHAFTTAGALLARGGRWAYVFCVCGQVRQVTRQVYDAAAAHDQGHQDDKALGALAAQEEKKGRP